MPMKVNITHLRRAIKESGFRQDYIAECCGVSGAQCSRILHGSRKLTADIFATICYTIGVKMEDFVRNENSELSATYRVTHGVYVSVNTGDESVYDKDVEPDTPQYIREDLNENGN